MANKKWQIWLTIVIILAAVLRLVGLAKVPVLFDGDEADLGYNAFALGLRGTDEYGVKLPVYFSSLGDFQYPAYVYLTVPAVKIFGLSETTTRTTSAVAGILSVPLLFWLVTTLSRRINLGLLAAGLLAASPWAIFFSRKAVEGNLGLMLVLLLACLVVRSRTVAAILVGLVGLFTYPATRIFLTLALPFLAGYGLLTRQKRTLLIGLVLTIAALATFISSDSRARGREISLLSPANLTQLQHQADLEIQAASMIHLPAKLTQIWDNKYVLLGRQFGLKILDNFNLSFLVTQGDNRPRYSLHNWGFITLMELALLGIGLTYLGTWPTKYKWASGIWALLAAIPSALTTENPHAIRFMLILPLFVILAATGLARLKNKLVIGLLALVGLGNLGYLAYQNVIQVTFNQPWEPETVMAKLPMVIAKHQNKYQQVLVPGDPYIFFLFTRKVDPNYFIANAHIDPDRTQWDRVNNFENIVFKTPGKCPSTGKVNILYFCPSYVLPANAKVIDYDWYADGVPAYALIEFVPLTDDLNLETPVRFVRQPNADTLLSPEGLIPENYPTSWL